VALTSGDQSQVDASVRRLEMLYSVVFSFGGIPLIYMGDEIALRNDPHWADDPMHAHDNRWMHRPPMDWVAAARRSDPESLEGRVFAAMRRLVAARRSQPALRAGGETRLLGTDNPHVLACRRLHPRSSPLLAATNFSDYPQTVNAAVVRHAGISHPVHVHSTVGTLDLADGRMTLQPWSFVWLTGH
jgi:amylosucrase